MPKQNVPALRLEGFSGEWGTTIVSAVADVVGGGTPSTSNPSLWDGDIDWYSPNEVGSDVVAKPSNRRITVEGLRASSAQLLPAHRTILYTSRASIGHTAILKHPATTNQGFQSLVLRDGMDTYFMYSLTPLITRKALKISSGSTFLEISAKALGTIEIPVPPTLEEQQAIGAIFTNLDAAINQHTLKHKALQQSKTALMQRMFPQEDQTVPELRLEGFDGEWCIKSLDELATVKSAARVHREQWRDSGVPFFRASDVSAVVNGVKNEKAFISHELYEELSAKSGKLRKGDLLVIGGGSIGTTYQVPNDGPLYSKDADVLWVQPNANVSSDYLETFFESLLFEKYLKSISHAGTIAHYTIIQAKRTLVPTPPTLAEQQAIGAVFTNLDQLIAAEAQCIKSLSQAKTALLQRMFI